MPRVPEEYRDELAKLMQTPILISERKVGRNDFERWTIFLEKFGIRMVGPEGHKTLAGDNVYGERSGYSIGIDFDEHGQFVSIAAWDNT